METEDSDCDRLPEEVNSIDHWIWGRWSCGKVKDLKVNQIQIYCMDFNEECVLCGHGCTHCLHSVSKDM